MRNEVKPAAGGKKYTTICAIIENDKREILLTKRAREPFKNCWALVSGIGESKKDIKPEIGVIEEINCDLGTKSFRGKFLFSLPIENDPITNKIDIFVGKISKSEIKIQTKFSADIKWVAKNQVNEFANLAFEHSKIIKKYLESLERKNEK